MDKISLMPDNFWIDERYFLWYGADRLPVRLLDDRLEFFVRISRDEEQARSHLIEIDADQFVRFISG